MPRMLYRIAYLLLSAIQVTAEFKLLTRLAYYAAGSMQQSGVRLSVRLSHHSPAARCCDGFAAGRPARTGDIDRLQQARRACVILWAVSIQRFHHSNDLSRVIIRNWRVDQHLRTFSWAKFGFRFGRLTLTRPSPFPSR